MRQGNNEFTIIIHSKGWTVVDACEFWEIRHETFYRRVNNRRKHSELRSMCKGLEQK